MASCGVCVVARTCHWLCPAASPRGAGSLPLRRPGAKALRPEGTGRPTSAEAAPQTCLHVGHQSLHTPPPSFRAGPGPLEGQGSSCGTHPFVVGHRPAGHPVRWEGRGHGPLGRTRLGIPRAPTPPLEKPQAPDPGRARPQLCQQQPPARQSGPGWRGHPSRRDTRATAAPPWKRDPTHCRAGRARGITGMDPQVMRSPRSSTGNAQQLRLRGGLRQFTITGSALRSLFHHASERVRVAGGPPGPCVVDLDVCVRPAFRPS